MNRLIHIFQITMAWLLLNAFVFPSVLQFGHIFEDHQHNFCGDTSTHLHEQQLDCDFTQFVSTVFSFKLPKYDIETVAISQQEPVSDYSSHTYAKAPRVVSLRGPPTA